ncbi:protein RRP5 homolog [Mya arenaria]|uniref:protein RRP5 homolog n=1 Tax=Mya arenaria TaxID=6604 RepID=UPI0022DEC59E|nr:protein RRP5 homolog [Mya arenaria]
MNEENFPRGGRRDRASTIEQTDADKKSHKKVPKRKDENLFAEKDGSSEKKKGKRSKSEDGGAGKQKKSRMEGDMVGKINILTPTTLNKKSLYPGMLMLGYVKAVHNLSLTVALPNGLSGVVEITNISTAYTESLQQFAQQQEDGGEVESVASLGELFHAGQLVPCKLLEGGGPEDGRKLNLSINPRDVNGDIQATSLRHGMCVYGSVMSVEDHGYIMDIGVKGVQGFVKHKHAGRYIQLHNKGHTLCVGQLLMCGVNLEGDRMAVLTGQHRVLNLIIDPAKLHSLKMSDEADVAFSALLPGMKVTATVQKVVGEKGVVLKFHSSKGVVHNSHLSHPAGKYTQGQEVSAVVLSIHPLVKTIHLSLLPHLADYTGVPTPLFPGVGPSTVLEAARVTHADKTQGVFLTWQDKLHLYAQLHNLSDKKIENVALAFKPGTTHRSRILGFYPMENLVIVTLKRSVVDEKLMSITDIHPGELIECTVKELKPKGIVVEMGYRVSGFIPSIHLADVTLTHPEEKFKVGTKLKCRVLEVNRKRSRVYLTHKRSLLNSKYPLISAMDQVETGMVLEGFVSSIQKFGVFVTFYNHVQGLVPRPLLSSEPIPYPEKVFYVGQVVRCKVISVQQAEGKLKLSFVLEGKKEFGAREKIPEGFKVGECVKCVVAQKNATGLDVEIGNSGKRGFLPRMHLSDSVDLCTALWEKYRVGDEIETTMYWNKNKVAILTCKLSLIEAAKEGDLCKTFGDIEPGMMLPGAIKNIMPYGVFVEFANGLFGLVPNQYGVDKKVPDLGKVYRPGQTVVGKVVEVNQEKARFLASLRMQDCYHGNTETGLDITEAHLSDRQKLLDIEARAEGMRGTLARIPVGSVHKVMVTQVTDLGVIGQLESGVKVVVTKAHMKGVEVGEGESVHGAVLYIDLNKQCVEVSLLPQLVKDVDKRTSAKNTPEKAKVGQKVKCVVLLVKDDYVLVSLKGHCRGQLAYLPARRHWNDVLEKFQYEAGQENAIIIKRIDGETILGSLKVHEDREKEDEDRVSHIPTHNLKLGDICTARTRKIYSDQIYINISGTHGRVHQTEMLDKIENGTSPIPGIKSDSEVKVRVIGFREAKTFKYLPISHPNLHRAMPECSMKPSILAMETLPPDFSCTTGRLDVGSKVVAFVTKVTGQCVWTQVSPSVMGKVHILHLSDDVKVLKKFRLHYIVGKGYNATVIGVENDAVVELSFCAKKVEVQEGRPTRGIVTCVQRETGLVLQLPDGVRGTVNLTDITDHFQDSPTTGLKKGDIITGTVEEFNLIAKRAVVSLRPKRKDEGEIHDPRVGSVAELKEGQVLRGYITSLSHNGIHVSLGHGVWGMVPPDAIIADRSLDHTTDHFTVGQVVTVKVKSKAEDGSKINLSMLQKDTGVAVKLGKKKQRQRKRTLSSSSVGSDDGVSENKKVKRQRSLSAGSVDMEQDAEDKAVDSDVEEDIADHVDLPVMKVEKKKKSGKKKSSDDNSDIISGISDLKTRKISESSETEKGKKKKRKKKGEIIEDKSQDLVLSDKENEVIVKSKKVSKNKKDKTVKTAETVSQEVMEDSEGHDSDSGIEVKVMSTASEKKPVLDVGAGFSWDTEFKIPALGSGETSDEDSDDDNNQPQVKKSKEEIRREKAEEEKKLYKYEMEVLGGDRRPETSDDFDRLVLQSPNSSLVWLRYMAFHLESTEIDKARSVAERALKTISFREEQEKLNVWVAYLNLENMYGTSESVGEVLARATKQCDSIAVNLQMVNIYTTSGKMEEAEQVYNNLVRKHSVNKNVWLKFGEFYFQQGRSDSARKLMQRALKSLDMRHHVDVITRFAQFEFKLGEPERGKTMFENTLSTYPRRTDLWSVYIDMVTKIGQHDNTRSLYNRVISQKMSAKKMKFFFKKFLQFEEKFGSPSQVAEVKRKALQYVEAGAE